MVTVRILGVYVCKIHAPVMTTEKAVSKYQPKVCLLMYADKENPRFSLCSQSLYSHNAERRREHVSNGNLAK